MRGYLNFFHGKKFHVFSQVCARHSTMIDKMILRNVWFSTFIRNITNLSDFDILYITA